MWGYVAIGIGVAMAGKLFWMIEDWGRDWTTNHAELSITNDDPLLHPIEIDADVVAVESLIRDWVQSESTWEIVAPASDSETLAETTADATEPFSMKRIHLTHRTPVFRFVDDVMVKLTPLASASGDPPRTRVDASSRSRVGKGDLGQNPRNLKTLRAGIVPER